MPRRQTFLVRNNGPDRQARHSLPAPVEKAQASRAPAADKHGLWLCIYLPGLAIDALNGAVLQPVVVYGESAGRAIVQACNQAAINCGIHPDTTVAAALSLCGTLEAYPRDSIAEQQMVNRLAQWALGFSSEVSLYTADAIMLEIKGSLRLFGGMKALIDQIAAELAQRTSRHTLSVAPTPRAAFWLAQSGSLTILSDTDQLAGVLRDVPVGRVAGTQKQCLRLERSGIRTLGDLMRLPRDGLVRRFGADVIKQLDQALARETEPMAPFRPPEQFSAGHEFYAPTCDLALIKPAVLDLLRLLEAFLIEREAATQQVHCVLAHEKQAATVINAGCRHSMRRADEFACLLDTHLDQLRLRAEAVAVTLRCKQIDVFSPQQLDLFEHTSADQQSWHKLLSQMEARLGRSAVRHLAAHADYRPEKASGYGPKWNGSPPINRIERPLWLLAKAESLSVSGNNPCWQGPLQLETAIERIEQGWWDNKDISRDYRVARSQDGVKLWLYRDRRRKRWFLHGLFG